VKPIAEDLDVRPFHSFPTTNSAGSSGILGGFGINCMLPLFFELILETVYGFVRDDVAATTTMLTMSLGSTSGTNAHGSKFVINTENNKKIQKEYQIR